MKTFYVTFGGLLFHYHQEFQADREEIVRAWMIKRSRLNCWSRILEKEPTDSKPLSQVQVLHYAHEDHI